MISLRLSQIAEKLEGRLYGGDLSISSVCSDTRNLRSGDFFVALEGPHFNAHDYLHVAAEKGAAAALTSSRTSRAMPCIQVADTRLALGGLAAMWRQASNATVIAITGSNGKTTVKEMLAAILSTQGPTLATDGNLNNDIGMPLTLCRLQDEHFAVLEMGANHPQEIDYLSRIAQPDVAVLNNAGPAHLEGFGNLDGVARAKAEVINGLHPDGLFVYNHDDAYAGLWREKAGTRPCLSFGCTPGADIYSPMHEWLTAWDGDGFVNEFPVITQAGRVQLRLRLAGAHNRMNALAATAVAQAQGVDLQTVTDALGKLSPVVGRLQHKRGAKGMRILDDSYNANPESVRVAVDLLATAPGRRILVLGDLGELGSEAQAQHARLGTLAEGAGVDCLFTCGKLSAASSRSFGGERRHFDVQQELIHHLLEYLQASDTVLIKGSRAAHMECVVEALCEGDLRC